MIEPIRIDSEALHDDGSLRQALGLTPAALAAARRAGSLRYTSQGKRFFYKGAWILAWLDKAAETASDRGQTTAAREVDHAPDPRSKPALAVPGSLRLADPIDQPEAANPKRTLPAGIEPMVGIDDLAAWLGCSRRLLERLRAAGKVPRPDLHVGRMPRWRPETIRRWIEGRGRP